MPLNMFIWIIASLALILMQIGCGDRGGKYEIDFMGARELVFGQLTNTTDEIRVYISQPRKRFDNQTKVNELISHPFIYSTVDSNEISQVRSDLRNNCNDAGLSDIDTGRTCHILLLNTNSMKVLHFRVFMPIQQTDMRLLVYPRSDTKFIYANSRIYFWLKHIEAIEQNTRTNSIHSAKKN